MIDIFSLSVFKLVEKLKENKLPITVFDMNTNGNLLKLISGENIGTVVKN